MTGGGEAPLTALAAAHLTSDPGSTQTSQPSPPRLVAPPASVQRRRRGGQAHGRGAAQRHAQAHRRWTTIQDKSTEWAQWEAATNATITEHERGDAVKYVVPPRAGAGDQTYVLFALDGPFQLSSFSKNGRRFALFERVKGDPTILPPDAGTGDQEAASSPVSQQQASAVVRDKDSAAVNDAVGGGGGGDHHEGPTSSQCGQQSRQQTGLPGMEDPCAVTAGGAQGHSTIVGAGGGLLLAADMTLMLTDKPGASLVVGPCYANVHEGSIAMQSGSYAIGLSEIFTIDFAAVRRLREAKEEAAAREAAFLEELALEDLKAKPKRAGKKKKKSKKKTNDDPIPEEEEEPHQPSLNAAIRESPGEGHSAACTTKSLRSPSPAAPAAAARCAPESAAGDSSSGSESPRSWPPTHEEVDVGSAPVGAATAQIAASESTSGWSEVTNRKGRGKKSKADDELETNRRTPRQQQSPPPPPQQLHAASSASSTDHSVHSGADGGDAATMATAAADADGVKKSRGRRGGRRRRRGGKDKDEIHQQSHVASTTHMCEVSSPAAAAPASAAENREVSRTSVSSNRSRQGGQQHQLLSSTGGVKPRAWCAGEAHTQPHGRMGTNHHNGQSKVGWNYGIAAHHHSPGENTKRQPSPHGHGQQQPAGWRVSKPTDHPGRSPASVRPVPNWGNMRLGNGLFDPASGFAGPEVAAPPEAALMTSIAQYVLDD
jgi:hypothetical protein